MITLDQAQVRAIDAAAKKSDDGVKRALDPADQTDAAAIKAFLALSGKTPDTHPALHDDAGQLASQGGCVDNDHALQALEIVDAGRDRQGRATARVWHLDREGTFMAGSLVLVLDAESGAPLASGFANRVGGGLCPAATRSRDALPASGRITTIGFYHAQPTPYAAPRFGMIARTDTLAEIHNGER